MCYLRQAVGTTVMLALLVCGVYPALVTGLGQILFADQVSGSLIYKDQQVVGSALIGQRFFSSQYVHGRPSAAGTMGYDAGASGGSNLGVTSAALAERMESTAQALRTELAADVSGQEGVLPVDLLTASGSGLDPHISPEAALMQAERVARARNLPVERVRALMQEHVEPPEYGLFGEPRVNVLRLNLALDALSNHALGQEVLREGQQPQGH